MTCAKQLTLAIVVKGIKFWTGSNYCLEPQEKCPREGVETGVGYHLCTDVCKQTGHAEVMACAAAGDEAEGADLYLIGHTYCCENCLRVMKDVGIKRVFIMDGNGGYTSMELERSD